MKYIHKMSFSVSNTAIGLIKVTGIVIVATLLLGVFEQIHADDIYFEQAEVVYAQGGSGGTSASTNEAVFNNDLYYGMYNNEEVTLLQHFLKCKGIYEGPNTGNFLDQTRLAVAEYQRTQGISPSNGYFGPRTRNIVEHDEVCLPRFYTTTGGYDTTIDSVELPQNVPLFVFWFYALLVFGLALVKFGWEQSLRYLLTGLLLIPAVIACNLLISELFKLAGWHTLSMITKESSHFLTFDLIAPSLNVLHEWFSAISITKEDIINSLGFIVWPAVVLIVALFFKKVFTYMFFSMEEFNFFGARGKLIDVKTMITKEAEKIIQKQETEKRLATSSDTLESIEKAAKHGSNEKHFLEVVNIARQLAEENKALQKRLRDEIKTLSMQSKASSEHDRTDANMFLLSHQIGDSITTALQRVVSEVQTIAENNYKVLKKMYDYLPKNSKHEEGLGDELSTEEKGVKDFANESQKVDEVKK